MLIAAPNVWIGLAFAVSMMLFKAATTDFPPADIICVKRGNTFFLDTERMAGTPLKVLVPSIMEQREKEFLALGNVSTPSKFASTYYGFSEYTGALTPTEEEIVGKLEAVPIGITRRRPSYRRTMFWKCSDDLTDLLLNCLRAALAVPQAIERGAVALGVRGDSRAVGPLRIAIKRAHDSWRHPRAHHAWSKARWALLEVGFPRSRP